MGIHDVNADIGGPILKNKLWFFFRIGTGAPTRHSELVQHGIGKVLTPLRQAPSRPMTPT